jgi:hypothetical protein
MSICKAHLPQRVLGNAREEKGKTDRETVARKKEEQRRMETMGSLIISSAIDDRPSRKGDVAPREEAAQAAVAKQ